MGNPLHADTGTSLNIKQTKNLRLNYHPRFDGRRKERQIWNVLILLFLRSPFNILSSESGVHHIFVNISLEVKHSGSESLFITQYGSLKKIIARRAPDLTDKCHSLCDCFAKSSQWQKTLSEPYWLITNKLSAGMLHHPRLGCTQKEFDRSECNSSKNLRTCIRNDQIKISSNLIVKCTQPWADCCQMRVWHRPKSGKFTSPLFISIYI